MKNPLQDQLLKAGLVKKAQVAQVAREQAKARQGKKPPPPTADQRDAERARQDKAERDRALAAERNAQARLHELRAQARQIIETQRVQLDGEIEYRFTDGAIIRSVLVNVGLRSQLASGVLVIVRHDASFALLPRAAAEKVRERDPSLIVLDNALPGTVSSDGGDDEYYRQFQVPDDLIW